MKLAAVKIAKARVHGVRMPVMAWKAAHKAGVPYYVACSLLMQESNGGENIFGHDPSIYYGAGLVTETNYAAYKRQRGPTGQGGMQGVGPCQLTWWSIQDDADRRGGCWRPEINILTGLLNLKSHKGSGTWVKAAHDYNGSGPAADAYAHTMSIRFAYWKKVLG